MSLQRRHKMNLLLRPTLQLKLPAVVLILTLGFVALQVAHTQLAYGKLFDVVFEEAGRPPFLKDLLREQTSDYLEVTTVLTLVYIFVVVIVSVAYGHRMIGPMVPLRRQTEALKNGDYGARVTLRKRDAFGELAEDLNELARLLEENEKTQAVSAQNPGEA